MQSDYVRYITIDNTNTWSSVSAYRLELGTNKVTSISSSSTDTQYPSAKAVYDYAQEKLTAGANITIQNNVISAIDNTVLNGVAYREI